MASAHALEDLDYEELPAGASFSAHMIAGACAGILEHCMTYPIDMIRTRMQVLHPSPQASYGSVSSALYQIASSEGRRGLFRGISALFFGAGPSHAFYFATYEELKELMGGNEPGHHPMATVVKQRMQVHGSQFRSSLHCFRSVLRTEGFRAFYMSYPTTLALAIPFQSINFAAYESLRKVLNPSGKYDPLTHVIAGGGAGALAAALTTPLDVTKTTLQTQMEVTAMARLGNGFGFLEAVKRVYKARGIGGFFAGWQPRVYQQMPATAICWSVYEYFKWLLLVSDRFKFSASS